MESNDDESNQNSNENEIIENYLRPWSERDPNLQNRITRPVRASRGLGFRNPVNEEEERIKREELEQYELFEHKKRDDQENFKYVEEFRSTSLESIGSMHITAPTVKQELPENIYQNPKYNFFGHVYKEFPILAHRQAIIEETNRNNIVIIQGDTGCGKTTLVPQIILDHHAQRDAYCNMLITQPRRIAAKSIPKYVSEQRGWVLGTVCGYKVANEKLFSKDTRITYVTTGYLIELIISDENQLKNYTHIMLDEIHDREIDTDLIILIMKILIKKKFDIKLILMSATLQADEFIKYYTDCSNTGLIPVIKCQQKVHDVKSYYFDDFNCSGRFEEDIPIPDFDLMEPKIFEEQLRYIVQLLKYIDKREVGYCRQNGTEVINGLAAQRGSVLIFVPGMEQIGQVRSYLEEYLGTNNLVFISLHSEISLEQQMKVFHRPDLGVRKVVISTSIAESSITVSDIKYVIDFCLTKSLHRDDTVNNSSLILEWATKSSSKQRMGRAGRTSTGSYYCLVTKRFYQSLYKFPEPAISKEPLDGLILNIKKYTNEPVTKILANAMTSPPKDAIDRTMLFLKEVGAISLYKNKVFCAHDGDITFVGRILSVLPIDLKLGKLIIFGHIFGKLRESIILAATLANRSIFSNLYGSQIEVYKLRQIYSNGLNCDFNAILTAYFIYEHKKSRLNKKDLRAWCTRNGLEYSRLYQVDFLIKKIEDRLKEFKITVDKTEPLDQKYYDLNNDDSLKMAIEDEQMAIDEYYVIKFMVAGAFYPNYFKTELVNEDEIMRTLSGKDPRSTICVKGIRDYSDDAVVYHNELKRAFRPCSENIIMHYEKANAFLEFKENDKFSAKVCRSVYIAIYMRRVLGKELVLRHANKNDAYQPVREIDRMRRIEGCNYLGGSTSRITAGTQDHIDDANLLLKDLNEFRITVTSVDQPGHFWCQIAEPAYKAKIKFIQDTLNSPSYNHKMIRKEDLKVGKLVATIHFESDGSIEFYRARITQIKDRGCKVLFIDYGNSELKDFNLMCELSKELSSIPHQAIQCELVKLRINPIKMQDSRNYEKACGEFCNILENVKILKAKVYSIVENIVRISLIDASSDLYTSDLSSRFIKIDLFETCNESAISESRHNQRVNGSFLNQNNSNSSRSRNEWINISNLEEVLDRIRFDDHYTFPISPISPLECIVSSRNRNCSTKSVSIENTSVNHVLLDDEPHIRCSSLLVASKVDKTIKDKLILRNTTLFPKINGMFSLCLMTFSPVVEMRVDMESKTYSGALCGLGYEIDYNSSRPRTKPLFTEHDVEDIFDVRIDNHDLKLINATRTSFNIFGSKEDYETALKFEGKIKGHQKNAREALLHLLKKKREVIEPSGVRMDHYWNKLPQKYMMQFNRSCHEKRIRNKIFYDLINLVDFSLIK